jgi:hypothetical protein
MPPEAPENPEMPAAPQSLKPDPKTEYLDKKARDAERSKKDYKEFREFSPPEIWTDSALKSKADFFRHSIILGIAKRQTTLQAPYTTFEYNNGKLPEVASERRVGNVSTFEVKDNKGRLAARVTVNDDTETLTVEHELNKQALADDLLNKPITRSDLYREGRKKRLEKGGDLSDPGNNYINFNAFLADSNGVTTREITSRDLMNFVLDETDKRVQDYVLRADIKYEKGLYTPKEANDFDKQRRRETENNQFAYTGSYDLVPANNSGTYVIYIDKKIYATVTLDVPKRTLTVTK